jgi:hypothetical protein
MKRMFKGNGIIRSTIITFTVKVEFDILLHELEGLS